jgi:septation ring formation regulator EzrA
MPGDEQTTAERHHSRLDAHDNRLRSVEADVHTLKREQAVMMERQRHHGIQMGSLQEIMNQLIDKVGSNTKAVGDSRDVLMERMNKILLSLLIATITGAFAVASSILVWWLSR